MRIAAILTTALLAATMTTSCVSTKKYNTALQQESDLRKQYQDLKSEYGDLQQKYEADLAEEKQLQASSTRNLKEKENELMVKERELARREAEMSAMREMIDAQKNAIASLKEEVCSALKCFTPDELKVEVRDGKLYVSMSDKLLFPSGSDQINERGLEAIEMLSVVLSNSELEVMVEGHTDSIPISTARNHDNWDLSAHRATSVTRAMIEHGIDADRIIACGRGKFKPVSSNESKEGRQLNRRTEIVLAPRLDRLWKLTETDGTTAAREDDGSL